MNGGAFVQGFSPLGRGCCLLLHVYDWSTARTSAALQPGCVPGRLPQSTLVSLVPGGARCPARTQWLQPLPQPQQRPRLLSPSPRSSQPPPSPRLTQRPLQLTLLPHPPPRHPRKRRSQASPAAPCLIMMISSLTTSLRSPASGVSAGPSGLTTSEEHLSATLSHLWALTWELGCGLSSTTAWSMIMQAAS